MLTVIERKSRLRGEPRRQGTAIGRVLNIPNSSGKFNGFNAVHPLLNKPLKCCLIGLVNKLDRLEETNMHRSLIDCANHLLNELGRFDRGTV
jgi:hypothetical protein